MTKSAVKSVSFENYRAFKAKQTIDLKPITLLYGYNNSGKSAALRFLPLLASSFDAVRRPTYTQDHLNYATPCIRGATFSEITYGDENKLGVGIEWLDGAAFDCEIKQSGPDPEVFSYVQITTTANGLSTQQKYLESTKDVSRGKLYEASDDPSSVIHAQGFVFHPEKNNDIQRFELLRKRQQDFADSVHWLASVRAHPPREFEIGAGIEIGIKHNGEGTAQTLWHLAETAHAAFEKINTWLAATCGRRIDISTSATSARSNGRRRVKLETIAVQNESPGTGAIRIPILDLGEGIAQALPVITLCAQAAHGDLGEHPIVVIEQPELHLHPRAMIELANFMMSCAKLNRNVRFVIETHSESLLLALQTAVVDETAKTDDVACYWVHPDPSGSGNILTSILIDGEGFISDEWPDEVFDETLGQSRKLIAKREAKATAAEKNNVF